MPEAVLQACTRCGQQKDPESFPWRIKNGSRIRHWWCRACHTEAQREWRIRTGRQKAQSIATCVVCGVEFAYKWGSKGRTPMYCSEEHRKQGIREYHRAYRSRNRPREMRVECGGCGKPIERTLMDIGQPKQYCDRVCANRSRAFKKLGITAQEYNAMLTAQGSACRICGGAEPGGSKGIHFHIDHCHESGAVRGLLCSPCNQALGLFKDSPQFLRIAAEYLERSKHGTRNP